MSVQFGRWNFEEQPPAQEYIEQLSAALAPYGPDSNESYSKGGVSILYRAFYTTKESRREVQPHICQSGAALTWDGRLDNRADLISELPDSLAINSTDVAIVAVAHEKWGINCLAKLIGDWALTIWNPRERSVLLAKDPIGTKHLYYSFDGNQVTWSTILDPLVRLAGKTFALNEEFIAGWLSMFPAVHLTPCVGIHSVPPSSYVLLRPGRCTVRKYWDFDPEKRIRYHADAEYEEHFRTVFAKAVQRKLRSDRPVLAELSGGRDSSSSVSTRSPTTTTPNPTGTSAPISPKLKKSAVAPAGTSTSVRKIRKTSPQENNRPNLLTVALCQLPATTVALLLSSGCVWPHKEIVSCFPASVATKSWAVSPHPRPNLRIFSQEHNSAP